MEQMFDTQVYSLSKLHSKRFIIPSYQRPFVWGEEQINKLLSDFYDAYLRGDRNYFIGTVLTSQKGDVDELIDGQQRFTTLWLISVSFKILGIKSSILEYLRSGEDLRFDFAIRKQLKSYLLSLMEKTKNEKNQYSDSEVENDEYLVNVARAVTTITKKIETFSFLNGTSIECFGDYIFENIQFVKNTAPIKTNLNKLFSTINNSGVQLEQSDILKSKLLHLISKNKFNNNNRLLYSKIWEACENMENYFEKNVRKLFPKTFWLSIERDTFNEYNAAIFKFKEEINIEDGEEIIEFDLDLDSIINKDVSYNKSEIDKLLQDTEDDDESEKIYCRSIINFSQLLLHTCRVYLFQNKRDDFALPFHIKYLLDIFKAFENEDEEFIKGFFLCLWRVRFAFDKYIVKWVQKSEDKEEELKITSVSSSDKNNNRFFSRIQPESKDESTMLQSVLYFTGNYNTQIWLSPFLNRLLANEDPITLLEEIDNKLSLSLEEDKSATFRFMNSKYSLGDQLNFEAYLNGSHSTSFKHYWFQKLEYILWKHWENKRDPKYKEFRITSKNSIEHVFPQNHEFEMELDKEYLNCFGNLGLLSVSQNSSYSNKDVEKKKIDFDRKPIYDSLKLSFIYNEQDVRNWGIRKIKEHQKEMIERIKYHYNF